MSKKKFNIGNKKYKLVAIPLAVAIISGGAKIAYDYNTNVDVKRQINRFLAAHIVSSSYYSIPDGVKYSDFNYGEKTYYVHKKDSKVIVSDKEYVKDYECLGIYDSKNSADAIFYYKISNGTDMYAYEVVSYDDIEGNKSPFNVLDDVTLIDENSPDEVSAYVPEPSIKPLGDYAKSMN